MTFKIDNIKTSKILTIFLVLILVSGFLVKLINVYHLPITNRVSGILKLVLELVLIYIIITSRKFPKVLWYPIILTITFIIGNMYLLTHKAYNFTNSLLEGNFYYLNRYLFVFLLAAAFFVIEMDKKHIQKIIKYFLYVVYLNTFFMIVGILSDIEVFRSYPYTPRFGYSGLFPKIAEATHIYFIAICAVYYKYIHNKSLKNLIPVLVLIFFSLFLGTKAVLLFLFFLGIIHFCFMHSLKKYFRIAAGIFIVSMIVLKDYIIEQFFVIFPFWKALHNDYGILTVITSTRNLLFSKATLYIEKHWEIINYFFGGIDYRTYKVEFEWVDVFTMFGILGLLIFINFYRQYFFNTKNRLKIGLLLIILAVSFFSGAMFLSVTSMSYFYILALYLEEKFN